MAQEIPVYVFTGFMDSGKTSLVEETLFENEFWFYMYEKDYWLRIL